MWSSSKTTYVCMYIYTMYVILSNKQLDKAPLWYKSPKKMSGVPPIWLSWIHTCIVYTDSLYIVSRCRPFMRFACKAFSSTCTAGLPWRSWEPFNFFVPSTMSESLFFHQLFFCDAAASSHLVGMFPDENHTARHTSLELDLDQQCTPTILMTMLFFFCRLLVIKIGSNQC